MKFFKLGRSYFFWFRRPYSAKQYTRASVKKSVISQLNCIVAKTVHAKRKGWKNYLYAANSCPFSLVKSLEINVTKTRHSFSDPWPMRMWTVVLFDNLITYFFTFKKYLVYIQEDFRFSSFSGTNPTNLLITQEQGNEEKMPKMIGIMALTWIAPTKIVFRAKVVKMAWFRSLLTLMVWCDMAYISLVEFLVKNVEKKQNFFVWFGVWISYFLTLSQKHQSYQN